MADRVTQEAVEVLQQPNPFARTTQEAVEVLQQSVASALITQEAVEVLWTGPRGNLLMNPGTDGLSRFGQMCGGINS